MAKMSFKKSTTLPAKPQIVEKIVYVDRIVEVVKNTQTEVDKIVNVVKEVEKEVIKLVPTEVEKIVNVTKEVEKFIEKEIYKVPKWVWSVISIETIMLIVLLTRR